MQTNQYRRIAFLAALAKTPPGEPVPPVDPSLLNAEDAIAQLRQPNPDTLFWQNYDQFYTELMRGYTVKPRAKMLQPRGDSTESDRAAEQEVVNVSLSADEILGNRDPALAAREQFQNSSHAQISSRSGQAGFLQWALSKFRRS